MYTQMKLIVEKRTMDEQDTYIEGGRNLSWLKVLAGGLFIYTFGVFALAMTRNTNIFPTVVMIGNFQYIEIKSEKIFFNIL